MSSLRDFGPHRGALRYLLLQDPAGVRELSLLHGVEISTLLTTDTPAERAFIDAIWDRVAGRSSLHPSVGLDASRLFQFRDLGERGWLLHYAPDFSTAWSQAQKQWSTPSSSKIQISGDFTQGTFQARWTVAERAVLVHYFAGALLGSIRGLGVDATEIIELSLPEWSAPGSPDQRDAVVCAIQDAFRVTTRFSGELLQLRILPEVSSKRLRTADAAIFRFFESRIENAGTEHDATPGLLVEVKQVLRTNLSSKDFGALQLSQQLGLSQRTLERSLSRQGLSLRAVRQEMQREATIELLQLGLTSKEVADRVGFEDVASFSRAFRRWTGKTPSQYSRR
jgi:AraC-like DNA-binding protein